MRKAAREVANVGSPLDVPFLQNFLGTPVAPDPIHVIRVRRRVIERAESVTIEPVLRQSFLQLHQARFSFLRALATPTLDLA
jgi:hypothetical protein